MSKFSFDSVEHALASVAHDTVVAGRAVALSANKIQKAAPEIEGVTGLIDPSAVVIERAAFAALGSIAKAANDTAVSASANGLNVPLDEATIKDYSQIYQLLAAKLPAQTQTAPGGAAAVPPAV
jgi:hypothetical protein